MHFDREFSNSEPSFAPTCTFLIHTVFRIRPLRTWCARWTRFSALTAVFQSLRLTTCK